MKKHDSDLSKPTHVSTGGKKPVTRSYAPAFQNLTFDETVLAQGGFALPASARAALVASGFFEELQEPPYGVVSALETPSSLLVADAFFGPCNNLSLFKFRELLARHEEYYKYSHA